jgi:hypothetical protein
MMIPSASGGCQSPDGLSEHTEIRGLTSTARQNTVGIHHFSSTSGSTGILITKPEYFSDFDGWLKDPA